MGVVPGNRQPVLPHAGGSVCPKSVGYLCGGDAVGKRSVVVCTVVFSGCFAGAAR